MLTGGCVQDADLMSLEAAQAAAAWFAQALGQPCRLVRQQTGSRRSVSLARQQLPDSPGSGQQPAEPADALLPGSLGALSQLCLCGHHVVRPCVQTLPVPPVLQALPTRASFC